MPSIKDLEMAAAVSSHPSIEIRKSFFSRKAVYRPTQSPVSIVIEEFAPSDGQRMEQLLAMPTDKMVAEIEQKGRPTPTPVGHFRLEACVSADRQFCALALFRFVDFKYSPAVQPLFFEGLEAEKAAKIIG